MYIFRRFLSISIQCAVLSLWLQGLDSHQRSFGYEPNGLTASPPCDVGCWWLVLISSLLAVSDVG
jgi:hypothetical protein